MTDGGKPVRLGARGTAALGGGLLAFGLFLVLFLINLWPAVEGIGRNSNQVPAISVFGTPWYIRLSQDSALLALVVLASALGGFVHSATSFATYVGNEALNRSWLWWYVLRTLIGVSLAILFYFAVRGGLLSAQAPSSTVNPYGVGALAAMVGLFSKQATDKLREIFETMFRTASGYGDDERKDKAGNPRPRIIGVEPARVPAGSAAVTLAIQGQGFVDSSVAAVTRPDRRTTEPVPRTMTYVTPSEIRVVLDEEDVAEVGTVLLTVVNPPPGGGASNTVLVQVHEPGPGAG
jgi:hypothetical protein